MADVDPRRHLMSGLRSVRLPDGSTTLEPIPLSEQAAGFRTSMDRARPDEAGLENDLGRPTIGFSRHRGAVIAMLLGELAMRLRPGVAIGPMDTDDAMADVALELASALQAARTQSVNGE